MTERRAAEPAGDPRPTGSIRGVGNEPSAHDGYDVVPRDTGSGTVRPSSMGAGQHPAGADGLPAGGDLRSVGDDGPPAADDFRSVGDDRHPDEQPAPGFEDLFRERFGAMVALARLLGSDDPENTAQDAFLRLHSRWSTLRDPTAATGYLRRTVVNLSHNRTRHLTVARNHVERERGLPAAASASAEADTLERARSDAILAALKQLSASKRAAIVLRFWLDLSFSDVADALGCPSATARSHVRRALQDLKPVLAEEGDTP